MTHGREGRGFSHFEERSKISDEEFHKMTPVRLCKTMHGVSPWQQSHSEAHTRITTGTPFLTAITKVGGTRGGGAPCLPRGVMRKKACKHRYVPDCERRAGGVPKIPAWRVPVCSRVYTVYTTV